jgi:predicted RND superfamily exporter protein
MAYLRFITRHPWPVVLAAAILAFAAFSTLVQLRIDNSMEAWLIEDDPALAAYGRYREEFQNDQFIVVGYEVPGGALSEAGLAVAERLTEAFERIDNVMDVTSLANMEEIRADGDLLTVGHLIEAPLSDAERKRVLSKLRSDPLYRRTLAGHDGKVGAIVIRTARDSAEQGHAVRAKLVEDVRRALARENGTFHITGRTTFDVELFDAFVLDQKRLVPVMGLVIVIVLGVLFRNVVGVVLPMVTVGMAVLWTFAVIATVGTPLSMVSGTLPVVLLAIGIADSVHLVSEYQEQLAAGKKKLDALSDGVRAVFVPCLFTSVTTSLGFLGMLVIRVRPIHDFGLYASIGTMLAFVATFTLVPAVLSLLPAPRVRNDIGGAVSDRLTARVFRVVSAHRRLVLGVSLGGLLLGVVGLPLVQVSANTYKFLPATNPAIRATDFIEATIGGVNTMEVMVSARDISSQEPLKNVQALEEIQALQRKLAAFPQVEATLSPVDFLSAMNRTFHEDREEYERIPESRELVGQLMLMYEMDAPDGEFYDYFNFDMTKARMTIRTSMSADHENSDLIAAVREASKGFESIEAVPTGTVVLFSNIQYHMLVGMIRGFCVAFFCVGLSMTLLLRNLRHALLAMIPGALPIVFIVGMTGWLGMKLGANSAMMGNIALGIAVDNAIHMLTRYRRLRHEGVVAHEAIEHASTVVGRPVLFTTLVLCAGFLVLCLSATIPNQRFGLLTALVLAGSLLGSVGTLPATILVMEEYFGKGPEEPSQQAKPDNGDASVEHSEAA